MIDNNTDKLKSIIHYICNKYNDSNSVGAIKMNKILWFFDKFWYQQHLESATSLSHYQREKFGPMIPNFYDIIDELEKDNIIKKSVIGPHSFKRQKYHCETKPNSIGKYLTEPQIAMLDEVADSIIHHFSDYDISEASHQNCWHSRKNGEEISIETVLWDDMVMPSPEMQQWAMDNADSIQSDLR
ncbi:MAG: SocA family protein [Alphaproteobacteria bacterium]|nr:SocA family protein [Alphaproteobacteria bacterium]